MGKDKHYHDRLTMALDDLLMCRRYCEKMLKLPVGDAFSEDRTIYEALFVALVVSYGRVFTTSNTTEKEYKAAVSNEFGHFRVKVIENQEHKLIKLHGRLLNKRDTAIAHSDANSRNYQHYSNSPLGVGHNPYHPYDHEEVSWALELIEALISAVSEEQTKIGVITFENPLV